MHMNDEEEILNETVRGKDNNLADNPKISGYRDKFIYKQYFILNLKKNEKAIFSSNLIKTFKNSED